VPIAGIARKRRRAGDRLTDVFFYKPPHGDTTILDSVAVHRRTLAALTAFLASGEEALEFEAAGRCHLCPEWPPLHVLLVVKTTGKLKVEGTADPGRCTCAPVAGIAASAFPPRQPAWAYWAVHPTLPRRPGVENQESRSQ
jgi:hypothetical protein